MEALISLIRFRLSAAWYALRTGSWARLPMALSMLPMAGAEEPDEEPRNRDQIATRRSEIKSRLQELDTEHQGQELPEEARSEWNDLNEEDERLAGLDEELEAREQRLAQLNEDPENRERGAVFHTQRPNSTRGEDIYDLSTIRASVSSPEEASREMRDRALRSVEEAVFPHPKAKREDAQSHIERLLDSERGANDGTVSELARRILVTGSPLYKRAFAKSWGRGPAAAGLTNDEARALSVGTGSGGGFAVVYTLDPTIVPTSNLSVNPYRAVSRVETISGTNEWRGVTSAGMSVARAAEATEASDNSPTLAQPAIVVQRVQGFVPVSIELTQDWGSLQSELASLIQDGKDDEEATSFTTGNGTAPNAQGVITGASTTVAAGGTAAFAIADLYKLEEALGPRFRPRASVLGNRFTFNKVRQFDTAGGSGVWLPNLQVGLPSNVPSPGALNATVIGYPAYEASAMAAALTTGSKILVLGDFRYFVIVDRVGLDIELIPHLFGASNRFPTGQRGVYAYWRNNSKVLDANAFRVLVTG